MLDELFNFIDRFELGPNSIDWCLVPRFFKHEGVFFKDEFADEYGIFWFSTRFSFYTNLMTYREHLERSRKSQE